MQQDVTLNIFFLYTLPLHKTESHRDLCSNCHTPLVHAYTFGFSIGASSYRVAQRGQWSVQRTRPRWGPPRPLQPVSVCPCYQF